MPTRSGPRPARGLGRHRAPRPGARRNRPRAGPARLSHERRRRVRRRDLALSDRRRRRRPRRASRVSAPRARALVRGGWKAARRGGRARRASHKAPDGETSWRRRGLAREHGTARRCGRALAGPRPSRWACDAALRGAARVRWRVLHGHLRLRKGRYSEAERLLTVDTSHRHPEWRGPTLAATWLRAQALGMLNRLGEAEALVESLSQGGAPATDLALLQALLEARRGARDALAPPPSTRELVRGVRGGAARPSASAQSPGRGELLERFREGGCSAFKRDPPAHRRGRHRRGSRAPRVPAGVGAPGRGARRRRAVVLPRRDRRVRGRAVSRGARGHRGVVRTLRGPRI